MSLVSLSVSSVVCALAGIPISTQISLLHSALKVSVWSVQSGWSVYRYFRPIDQAKNVLVLSVEQVEDDFMIVNEC
jgi:hypothetical protein